MICNEEIKRVTLNQVMNSFKNKYLDEDVELLVNIVNDIHERRMMEDDGEPMEVKKEEFDEPIKKLEKKNKRSYDFLLKAGDKFKMVVFKFCRRMIKAEIFPS